jgi:hypothetical protein
MYGKHWALILMSSELFKFLEEFLFTSISLSDLSLYDKYLSRNIEEKRESGYVS